MNDELKDALEREAKTAEQYAVAMRRALKEVSPDFIHEKIFGNVAMPENPSMDDFFCALGEITQRLNDGCKNGFQGY